MTPNPAAYNQAQYPATSPYSLPVAVPAYPVSSFQQPPHKPKNKLLIAGLILLSVAIIALGVICFIVFDPFDLFDEIGNIEKPAIEEVEQVFTDADVGDEVLSVFNYVITDNIQGPELAGTTIGDVQQNEDTKVIYSDATTYATFKNDYVEATSMLSVRMIYNRDEGTWSGENVTVGDATGEPLGPPDMETIEGSIMTILRTYDPSMAVTFAGSEIAVDAAVSEAGGTAIFTLTKAVENADPLTCTVTLGIKWSDQRGWLVSVDSVEGYEPPGSTTEQPAEQPAVEEQQPPANNENPNQTTTTPSGNGGGNNSNNPTMLLVCYSGDLVQVPGIIEFEGSHILLKSDYVIRVEFNNRVFITNYFELAGNGGWYRGEHTTVIGEISSTGSLEKAPLVINVDYD